MADLFFFGTLQDADLFRIVVGRELTQFEQTEAILAGYRVRRAANYPFPVLVPDQLGEAPGLIVHGFTDNEVSRVAFYETNEYYLQDITVRHGLGDFVTASAFFATEFLDATEDTWSIEAWATVIKPTALVEAELAMKLFGHVGLDEINNHWPDIECKAAQMIAEQAGFAESA